MEIKMKEIKDLGVIMGDQIEVELSDGEKFIGEFQIHPLADFCVLNQHGFPMNYQKILRKI